MTGARLTLRPLLLLLLLANQQLQHSSVGGDGDGRLVGRWDS